MHGFSNLRSQVLSLSIATARERHPIRAQQRVLRAVLSGQLNYPLGPQELVKPHPAAMAQPVIRDRHLKTIPTNETPTKRASGRNF